MGDPTNLLAAGVGARCPACAAALRPGAPWCTLCYTDLRPTPEPEPVPEPERAPTVPAAFDPLTAPASTLGLPDRPGAAPAQAAAAWPCGTCGTANALGDSVCAGCGAGFLAGLREAEGPLLALPVVGDLGALSRARRLGLAAGVVLLLSALVLLLGVLSS